LSRTKLVLDTSVLIQNNEWLEKNINEYQYIICSVVADELDNQKESSEPKRAFNGRTGLRFIEKNEENLEFVVADVVDGLPEGFDLHNNDNKIISCAKREGAILATKDRGLKIKAKAIGLECVELDDESKEINYDGYHVFYWDCMNDDVANKLNNLAKDPKNNIFNLQVNEFAILKDTSRPLFDEDGIKNDYEIQGILQWNGEEIINLKYKDIKNDFIGKVKPRNIQQKMLFSLMQNDDITIKLCSGGYGTGKDYCMLTNALDLIQKNKYDKIVWFRNPVNVKGIKESGFLPGTFLEKQEPFSAVLDDILGEQYGTEMFLSNGKLEIGNLGAVRGRTFKNSIIMLTEMQNCTTDIIQLLISRVGEDSIFIMNGDYHQLDDVRHNHSSVAETIEVLSGQKEFGWVNLEKVERSKTADLARLFDK